MTKETTERFLSLFKSNENVYQSFVLDEARSKGVKKEGRVFIQRMEYTNTFWLEKWEGHLRGVLSLGTLPINDDGMCFWGAIDIDDYTIDYKKIITIVKDKNLPFTVVRSKSGGLHLYVFFKEAIKASVLQKKLNDISSFPLRLPNTPPLKKHEIFPKQGSISAKNKEHGSLLNMPYFGGDRTTRYAMNADGESLTVADFLKEAEQKKTTEAEFLKIKTKEKKEKKKKSTGFEDAPLCLEHLVKQGFPEGSRNNSLYSLAVFFKKKYDSEEWKNKVSQANDRYMIPPLSYDEVAQLIKSVGRKDYQYKCKECPLISHCDPGICSTRKYGVGCDSSQNVTITNLVKINVEPPEYIVKVNNQSVHLDVQSLFKYSLFRFACAAKINIMPPLMKTREWDKVLNNLFDSVKIIEGDGEGTRNSKIKKYLNDFCNNLITYDINDIVNRKVFYCKENNRLCFKFDAFFKYVRDKEGDKDIKQKDIEVYFNIKEDEEIKEETPLFGRGRETIDGVRVRYWFIGAEKIELKDSVRNEAE